MQNILVLLQPTNFHHHRSGWLPSNQRCFTAFSAVFLGALYWKLPGTIPQNSCDHLNAASFDPAWMHGESTTPPALLRASASSLANNMTASILCHVSHRPPLQLPGQPGWSLHCT